MRIDNHRSCEAAGTALTRIGFICRTLLGALGALAVVGVASAQDELFHIDGTLSGDYAGPVAGPGDIDGDGTPDLLVGIPGRATIRLYSGRTRNLLFEIVNPPACCAGIGNSMSGTGDFDLDGTLDFVAGDASDNTITWKAGAVRVYSGVDGSEIAVMYGNSVNEYLGFKVAGLGDVNGDGIPDVGAAALENKVVIYGGPDGHVIRTHLGNTGTRPSIARVGDLDGDGCQDYVLGWPRDLTNGISAGRATVYSGRNGAAIHDVFGDTGEDNDHSGAHLGVSVAGVGDIDGDGLADFAVGAPGALCLGAGCGSATQAMVRVYSGLDAHVLYEWRGAEETTASTGGRFGNQIYGGGDVNGDGAPDILISAPYDGYGSPGSISVYSGRTGERLWRILGENGLDNLSYAAILGDLNHDGIDDFAIGNSGASHNGSLSGRVTVYSGDPGDLDHHCASSPTSVSPGILIDASGALGITNNFLTLLASGAVPDQPSLFFYGPLSPQIPFGEGWLCTGPPRIRLGPPIVVDPAGEVERVLDFTVPPLSQGPGEIEPGSTWSLQLFCRDPQGPGGSTFNLSDGLLITFPP